MTSQGAARATPTIGAVVVAPDGQRIGEVAAVAVDAGTLQPQWLVVTLASGGRTALPAFVASLTAAGELAVPFSRALVEQAPAAESDVLDEDAAQVILSHYGLAG